MLEIKKGEIQAVSDILHVLYSMCQHALGEEVNRSGAAVGLAPVILVERNDDTIPKVFKHDILAPILCRTKPLVRCGPQL